METGAFIRLYPIPYRQLDKSQRFARYDVIEALCWKSEDHRPESYKLDPDSIRIIRARSSKGNASVYNLWSPHISESLEQLRAENLHTGKSLGIVQPDIGSIRFIATKLSDAEIEERESALSVHQQSLLFNDNATEPLAPPDYVFKYRFTSKGKQSEMKLHDWEVQAAYWKFKQKYGEAEGLRNLESKYQDEIPKQNLYLILGTILAHPRQFIAIGILRASGLNQDQSLLL